MPISNVAIKMNHITPKWK